MSNVDRPDWKHWLARPAITVLEAIALSVNVNPTRLQSGNPLSKCEVDEMKRRVEIILPAVAYRRFGIDVVHLERPNVAMSLITPESARDFFIARRVPIPDEWRDGSSVEEAPKEVPTWVEDARQEARKLMRKHPKKSLAKIAEEIEKRRTIKGLRGKPLTAGTIERQALRGLKSVSSSRDD